MLPDSVIRKKKGKEGAPPSAAASKRKKKGRGNRLLNVYLELFLMSQLLPCETMIRKNKREEERNLNSSA